MEVSVNCECAPFFAQDNIENWRQFQQAAYAHNLDPHVLAMYQNANVTGNSGGGGGGNNPNGSLNSSNNSQGRNSGGSGMNVTRRKNATRETTSMLKAWLNEHRKNPYPTKGEKIMLAIITKMSLTQVSTWFANARRRLKKENKVTWTIRSCPSGGADFSDDQSDSKDEDEFDQIADEADGEREEEEEGEAVGGASSSDGFADESSATNAARKRRASSPSPQPAQPPPSKKIWSLADMTDEPIMPKVQDSDRLGIPATSAAAAAAVAQNLSLLMPSNLTVNGAPAIPNLPMAQLMAAIAQKLIPQNFPIPLQPNHPIPDLPPFRPLSFMQKPLD